MADSVVNKTEQNLKKKESSPSLPMRKNNTRHGSFTCSFQKQEPEHNSSHKDDHKVATLNYFPTLVEAVIHKPRVLLSNSRRTLAWRRRLEQPWMKGNEMQPFYKIWKHPPRRASNIKMPKLVHRTQSLPRSFKFPGELSLHNSGRERKTQQDFGIVRECCCSPRVRIKTFPGCQ